MLPLGVYNAILDLSLSSEVQEHKAFTFCSQLLQYEEWNEDKGIEFVRFGKTRFIDEYGREYLNNFLKPLKEYSIVEVDEYYSKHRGISMGYKVNSKLVYLHLGELKGFTKYIHKEEEHYTNQYLKDFTAFYQTLEIPKKEIVEAVKAKLQSIEASLLLNEDIPDGTYKIKTVNGKWINRKIDYAISHAKSNNLDAILHNGKIYTDTVEALVPKKAQDIKQAIVAQLNNLNKGILYAHADATSGRLHHNFTNLPSYILNIIGKENTLIEVDAVNSQPALLANMLTKSVDPLFYEKATKGVLYEYMSKKMETTREKVKPIVMNALFDDSPRYVSRHREQLAKIFPDLGKAISRIEEESKERLSISLQKFEVKLFIQQILPALLKEGIASCTKHDSVIIRHNTNDLKKVITVMQNVLKDNDVEMLFKMYSHKNDEVVYFNQNKVTKKHPMCIP
ncbi:MAG: hypothetical protein AAF600_12905 [Bacteroidota bacterium]